MQDNNGGNSWEKAARESRQLYSRFLGYTKWAIVLVALVLVGMAIFLI